MRKMYKNKKCCCALCKPHKRSGDCRWKRQDKVAIKRFARAVAEDNLDEL